MSLSGFPSILAMNRPVGPISSGDTGAASIGKEPGAAANVAMDQLPRQSDRRRESALTPGCRGGIAG
jgi:hypothetical protein